MCTLCNPLRGTGNVVPITGACECVDNMDESTDGNCIPGVTSHGYSLAAVILLVVNCLLILFTNFESLNGLKRQVNYLRSIAKHHLLLVVFFENTELTKLSVAKAHNTEDVYVKTIADKFAYEKRMVVKELQQYGILSVLSSPEQLTVNAINKYLELKAKQAI